LNRTARFKALYAIAIGAAAVIAVAIVTQHRTDLWLLLLIAAAFLLPGRVQGVYYRDLFRGRRLHDSGHSAEAVVCFERFLATLKATPWIRHLLWLSFSVYTPNVEAMALNNLGAALLDLGKFEESERSLESAIVIDPHYPLPFFNLAVLHSARGDRGMAERAAAESSRLGFTGGTIDTVLLRAQSLLARLQGRGHAVR
jgi:tetratricopeptide (TPR) repeat protein